LKAGGFEPLRYRGKVNGRLRPMEKLVAVSINNTSKAYLYFVTWKKRVINDDVGGEPVVILHDRGAVSALDRPEIVVSREDGSTGVFRREVAGQLLTFSRNYEIFVDDQTSSLSRLNLWV